ncbi:MAG: hypothetical protein K2Z81_22580, partial [Cyanobacteria bacterium]|nr:hypothetical protein [Cyanobacteriota bacterium]
FQVVILPFQAKGENRLHNAGVPSECDAGTRARSHLPEPNYPDQQLVKREEARLARTSRSILLIPD